MDGRHQSGWTSQRKAPVSRVSIRAIREGMWFKFLGKRSLNRGRAEERKRSRVFATDGTDRYRWSRRTRPRREGGQSRFRTGALLLDRFCAAMRHFQSDGLGRKHSLIDLHQLALVKIIKRTARLVGCYVSILVGEVSNQGGSKPCLFGHANFDRKHAHAAGQQDAQQNSSPHGSAVRLKGGHAVSSPHAPGAAIAMCESETCPKMSRFNRHIIQVRPRLGFLHCLAGKVLEGEIRATPLYSLKKASGALLARRN